MKPEDTINLIERMKLARLGQYKKWESIIKKIKNGKELSEADLSYFSRLTRIYKDAKTTRRTKIFHTKLGELDKKPACSTCGDESLFYCNMNDSYYCTVHVIGHDENEL